MTSSHALAGPHSPDGSFLGAFAWGLAAGVAAAAGALLGRKVAAQVKVGHGHGLKHRALDLAASVMQQKYPLAAMSTFLNGFHFYADELGRQVEAHHFCIHLRPVARTLNFTPSASEAIAGIYTAKRCDKETASMVGLS